MVTESNISKRTLICDLDGVFWRGDEAISGSAAAIAKLRAAEFKVIFISNNSYSTPETICAKLTDFGVPAQSSDLLTSASAAAAMMQGQSSAQGQKKCRAMVLGGPGLRQALVDAGVDVFEPKKTGAVVPDAVVAGFDPEFDFAAVDEAARAIRSGARFIATNRDPTYPVPGEVVPGAGALVAAIAVASGCEPEVAGKHEAPTVELTRQRIEGYAVVVGDRPSTDGALAESLGIDFALVLSGVTSAIPVLGGESIPDPAPRWVSEDLAALVPHLLEISDSIG